ncbi:MAG: formylglycine-generating enzyme family protein [Phycisphaerales bacterium]|nr:formylglycine-generating enzyme family protein [Phycisphaerales bacterium]
MSGDEYVACAERDGTLSVSQPCSEDTHVCITDLTSDCDSGWCYVPPLSFLMSRRDSQPAFGEYPQHPVVLTRAFVIQETEVTLAQWIAVMGDGSRPGRFDCGEQCPVSGLTVFDALEYANRLSLLEGYPECYQIEGCASDETYARECDSAMFLGADCTGYRLPSEAEWELAAGLGQSRCVADSQSDPKPSPFEAPCLQDVEQHLLSARYCPRSHASYSGCLDISAAGGPDCAGPGNVKEYPPNRLGIFGMHGNLAEMTGTRFDWPWSLPAPPREIGLEIDPGFSRTLAQGYRLGPTGDHPQAVVRKGGLFAVGIAGSCSFSRSPVGLGRDVNSLGLVGFRLVRTVPTRPRHEERIE